MLVNTHHVAHDNLEAVRLALDAGMDYDLELSNGNAYRPLSDQVRQGLVPASEVDKAAARILTEKFRLRLFENPYVDPDYAERATNGEEHRKIALELAREAIVLLENDDNLLPLDLSKLKTIAVIGPNAADVHLGGYSRDRGQGISILDGIRARAASKPPYFIRKAAG
jgi:beta-glucosidase